MREIVLDTETTGLSPKGDPPNAHRIVEIGCVELVNHVTTGKTYHQYINPERDMPVEAFNVHGLSEEYLADFPVFADVAQAFLDFIGDDRLIIHNAGFDMGFINAELVRAGRSALPMERAVDTVVMARKKFPGAQANLDALCRRFDIDNSNRTYHGALLDSELLAEVYLELIGGRQPGLLMDSKGEEAAEITVDSPRHSRQARCFEPSAEERAAHAEFLGKLKDPIWLS
ncbi:DNA polymerase III subunit epsilon [Magnetospira sp. QH-2]|uniref:DNA polymerase III subunit epsilon n=1 Tax=Magnetospira sp. (strain QH-2) TaxID=1288970 RepID=UPI0003E818FE|nr:DNA polymerase III subunit epsilon [Magnetospira sp. QH-2]CCQ75626.1 DNA polymerase III subunit epsilon [Magnetospira sp. QH-2]